MLATQLLLISTVRHHPDRRRPHPHRPLLPRLCHRHRPHRGAAGAGELAEGIHQALVTTVGGLIVAIPSLAIYAVCRNRVDSMIAEVAYQSQLALTPIKRRPTRSSRTNAGQVSANQSPTSKPQSDAQSSSEANTVVGIQDSMRRAKTRKSPPRGSKE